MGSQETESKARNQDAAPNSKPGGGNFSDQPYSRSSSMPAKRLSWRPRRQRGPRRQRWLEWRWQWEWEWGSGWKLWRSGKRRLSWEKLQQRERELLWKKLQQRQWWSRRV